MLWCNVTKRAPPYQLSVAIFFHPFFYSRIYFRFETRQYPSLYWYADDERPQKARYGGKMDDTQILEFIKDQTGIQRTKSGALVENVSIFWKTVLQNISVLLLCMQRLDNKSTLTKTKV